jgi:hypothetical protein
LFILSVAGGNVVMLTSLTSALVRGAIDGEEYIEGGLEDENDPSVALYCIGSAAVV